MELTEIAHPQKTTTYTQKAFTDGTQFSFFLAALALAANSTRLY